MVEGIGYDDAGAIAGCVCGAVALLFAALLRFFVMRAPTGSGKQVEIQGYIQAGARAFLKTEYFYLTFFVILCTIVLILINLTKTWYQLPICFVLGAVTSAICGWVGMSVAVQANVRTAEAAKTGLNPALRVAFNGGGVMGMTVVGSGLLMISAIYLLLSQTAQALEPLAGFGMGASSIALFARVGGGIFTKAADVGADLVGKVENNIPEDDPRNPAVIADNVGDNVGDVAGMGADLFESYVGSLIGAITLAPSDQAIAVCFWVSAGGIIASIIGTLCVRTGESKGEAHVQGALLRAIRIGILVSAILVIGGTILVVFLLEVEILAAIVVIGLVAGVLIGFFTEYTTSYEYEPTLSISKAGITGPATVVIQGLGVGQLSTLPPVFIIAVTTMSCLWLGDGAFGVALAAVGMLSTLGVTLATDAYGPVADNAGGIAEMSGMEPIVRERTNQLDALGNTTAATGKGFAIGSAVLTALALMTAFVESVGLRSLDFVTSKQLLPGVIFGAMLPFLFSAFTMLAVRKSASVIIQEVRRQFISGAILAGDEEPDYVRCVSISTGAALREMVLPGYVAVVTPIAVGLTFGPECLAGLLIGAITAGFLLAVMMANAGGAWDNAKKYVETGAMYGPNQASNKSIKDAVVVGDTVGDPFKDTSGPALNILIKLMSIVALVFAPIFRTNGRDVLPLFWWVGLFVITFSFFVILGWYAYLSSFNKKHDLSGELLKQEGGDASGRSSRRSSVASAKSSKSSSSTEEDSD